MELAFGLEGLGCVVGDVGFASGTACDDGTGCMISCEGRCEVSKDVGAVAGDWTGCGGVCELGCNVSMDVEIVKGGFWSEGSIIETGFGTSSARDADWFVSAIHEVKELFCNCMGSSAEKFKEP